MQRRRMDYLMLGRLLGLSVVCFGRFWVVVPRSCMRGKCGTRFSERTHFHGSPSPPSKSESSASKCFRHSGVAAALKTAFEVFTRVGPDNSFERLTERSVGLVTDQSSDIDELFVTLFE
jgi:hypothetical protein